MTEQATYNDRTITISGYSWKVDFPVRDLRVVGRSLIVLYDYMSGPNHRQFKNLEAFDFKGNKLWTAEHPDNATSSVYVNFQKDDPLTIWNFGCYSCEIDPRSGKLLNAIFTK